MASQLFSFFRPLQLMSYCHQATEAQCAYLTLQESLALQLKHDDPVRQVLVKAPPEALTMGLTSFPSLSCRKPSVKGPPQ